MVQILYHYRRTIDEFIDLPVNEVWIQYKLNRMTKFIKTKISDDPTIIDKYRLAANITEYHIISKLILR